MILTRAAKDAAWGRGMDKEKTMKLDRWQQKTIALLLDAYERTKSYRGETKLQQNITVPVERVFPAYDRDDVPIGELEAFEASMRALEQNTPVRILYRDKKIKSQFQSFSVRAAEVEPVLYELGGRRPKREIHAGEVPVYEGFRGRDGILDQFIEGQEALLRADRNAWFDAKTAAEVMRTVDCIVHNRNDLLFRELSILLYGDTKYMERHGILHKAVRVLKEYGTYEFAPEDFDSEAEYETAVLAEYFVYENPTYVNFNGDGRLLFTNGTSLVLKRGIPVAIRSDRIAQIAEIRILDPGVLTIENLTSYNRLETQLFQLYLAGYHNRAKQNFLRKIKEQNPDVSFWYHFGDLDPDGFCILENLRDKTGIDFQPYEMTLENLRKYESFGKKLNDNDRRKAAGLVGAGKYVPVVQYMLDHDVKLEQEIISWHSERPEEHPLMGGLTGE